MRKRGKDTISKKTTENKLYKGLYERSKYRGESVCAKERKKEKNL